MLFPELALGVLIIVLIAIFYKAIMALIVTLLKIAFPILVIAGLVLIIMQVIQ